MRAEVRCRTRGAAVTLLLFALLTGLVAEGVTTPVDQYAVDHLMPGLYPYVGGGEVVTLPRGRLVEGWNPNRLLNHVADRITLPAAIPLATAIVLLAMLFARRIDRRAWLLGYAVAVAMELIGKRVLHDRAVFVSDVNGPFRLWKYDDSFPSGSAMRAVFLAGLVGTAWPRLRIPVVLWAACVVVVLVLAGTHLPSDVLGGVLVGGGIVLLCRSRGRAAAEVGPA